MSRFREANRRLSARAKRRLSGGECLEERRLLAITSFYDPSNGALSVASDDADDIVIRSFAGLVQINNQDPQSGPLSAASLISIHASGGPGTALIDLAEVRREQFPALVGTTIDFAGGSTSFALMSSGGGSEQGSGFDLLLSEVSSQGPLVAWSLSKEMELGPAVWESSTALKLDNADPRALRAAANLWLGPDWTDRMGIDSAAELDVADWRELLQSDQFVAAIDLKRIDDLATELVGADWMSRLGIVDLPSYLSSGSWRQLFSQDYLRGQVGSNTVQLVRQVVASQRALSSELVTPAGSFQLPESADLAVPRARLIAERIIGTDWAARLAQVGLGEAAASDSWSEIWNNRATWPLLNPDKVKGFLQELVGQDWAAQLGIVNLEAYLHEGQWRQLLGTAELAARFEELFNASLELPATWLGGTSPVTALLDTALEEASLPPDPLGAGMTLAMTSLVRTIKGSGLPDRIIGSEESDLIDGGEGADYIEGHGGADTIDGGEGWDADFIDGYDGDDAIDGGEGDDHLVGGPGEDWIRGGAGNDLLAGGAGNDQLFGDSGDDTIDGGEGEDVLAGGSDNDLLDGGQGNDLLLGDEGDDALRDASGLNQYYGGAGYDSPETVDDTEEAFIETGAWAPIGEGFNQSARAHNPADGEADASWTFGELEPGTYKLYVTWVPRIGSASNVRYRVSDEATFDVAYTVDQREWPADEQLAEVGWHSLGYFSINDQSLSVRLEGAADGLVVADAVRLVRAASSTIAIDPLGYPAVDVGHQLSLTVTASTADVPAEELHFSLDAGAPLGASMTPEGAFVWTPGIADPPGVYNIGIRVHDKSTPPRTGVAIVAIEVFDTNQAPRFAQVADQIILAGNRLEVALPVFDPNMPENQLSYTLLSGPAGATVDAAGFVWEPLADQSPGDYEITVRVTDDGVPPLSDEMSFRVTVEAPPAANQLPQIAELGLLNDTDNPEDRITRDPRIAGRVTHADGTIDAMPIEYDLNGDLIPDGTIYTDFRGDGSFLLDVAGLAHDPGTRTVRVRVGERDDLGLSHVFGDWQSLTFTLISDVAIADSDIRQFLPSLDSVAGYRGGSLAPTVGMPETNQAALFEGYVTPGGTFATFSNWKLGPTGGPFETTTIGDYSSHVPASAGLPEITTTVTSTTYSIATVDLSGNWTIDETLISTYLIVSSWQDSLDSYATLSQSGMHSYQFHASGDTTTASYTLAEERQDTFSWYRLATTSSQLATGALSMTVDTFSLDGDQGFVLAASGVASLSAGAVESTIDQRDYAGYAENGFDNLHTELVTLAADTRLLSASDQGTSGWNYHSERTTVEDGSGTSTIADVFSYSAAFDNDYDDESTIIEHSTSLLSGVQTDRTRSIQTSLSGTKSTSYGFEGIRTASAGGPIVVTDSYREDVEDRYAHSEAMSQESHDSATPGLMIESFSAGTITTDRDRIYHNTLGGVTTISSGGSRTYLGSTAGETTRVSHWSITAENSSSGSDTRDAAATRDFSSAQSSSDAGTGLYSFTSSGVVNIDAAGQRSNQGTSASHETQTGTRSSSTEESSGSHRVVTDVPFTISVVTGASSRSAAAEGTYQAVSQGTAAQSFNGDVVTSGSSTYQAQLQGAISHDHAVTSTVTVDEQSADRKHASQSASQSHNWGSSSYVASTTGYTQYSNADSYSLFHETTTETGTDNSSLNASGTSKLDDQSRPEYKVLSESSDRQQSTSTSNFSIAADTTKQVDSAGDWDANTVRSESESGTSWSKYEQSGSSSIEDRRRSEIVALSGDAFAEVREAVTSFTGEASGNETSGSDMYPSSSQQSQTTSNTTFTLSTVEDHKSSVVDASLVGTITKRDATTHSDYDGKGASSLHSSITRIINAAGEISEAASSGSGSEEGTRKSQTDEKNSYNQTDTSVPGVVRTISENDNATEIRVSKVTRFTEDTAATYADGTSESAASFQDTEEGTSDWTSDADSYLERVDDSAAKVSAFSFTFNDVDQSGKAEFKTVAMSQKAGYRDRTWSAVAQTESSEQGKTVTQTATNSHSDTVDNSKNGVEIESDHDAEREEITTENYSQWTLSSDRRLASGTETSAASSGRTATARGKTSWSDNGENTSTVVTAKDDTTTTVAGHTKVQSEGTGVFVSVTQGGSKSEHGDTEAFSNDVRVETGKSKSTTTRSTTTEVDNTAQANVYDNLWVDKSVTELRDGAYIDTSGRGYQHSGAGQATQFTYSRRSENGELTRDTTTDSIKVLNDETENAARTEFRHEWSQESGSGDYTAVLDKSAAREVARTFSSSDNQLEGTIEWTVDAESKFDTTTQLAPGQSRHQLGSSTTTQSGSGTFELREQSGSLAGASALSQSSDVTRSESGESMWLTQGDSKTTDTGSKLPNATKESVGTVIEVVSGDESYTSKSSTAQTAPANGPETSTTFNSRYATGSESRLNTKIDASIEITTLDVGSTKTDKTDSAESTNVSLDYSSSTSDKVSTTGSVVESKLATEIRHENASLEYNSSNTKTTEVLTSSKGVASQGKEETTRHESSSYVLDYNWTLPTGTPGAIKHGASTRTDTGQGGLTVAKSTISSGVTSVQNIGNRTITTELLSDSSQTDGSEFDFTASLSLHIDNEGKSTYGGQSNRTDTQVSSSTIGGGGRTTTVEPVGINPGKYGTLTTVKSESTGKSGETTVKIEANGTVNPSDGEITAEQTVTTAEVHGDSETEFNSTLYEFTNVTVPNSTTTGSEFNSVQVEQGNWDKSTEGSEQRTFTEVVATTTAYVLDATTEVRDALGAVVNTLTSKVNNTSVETLTKTRETEGDPLFGPDRSLRSDYDLSVNNSSKGTAKSAPESSEQLTTLVLTDHRSDEFTVADAKVVQKESFSSTETSNSKIERASTGQEYLERVSQTVVITNSSEVFGTKTSDTVATRTSEVATHKLENETTKYSLTTYFGTNRVDWAEYDSRDTVITNQLAALSGATRTTTGQTDLTDFLQQRWWGVVNGNPYELPAPGHDIATSNPISFSESAPGVFSFAVDTSVGPSAAGLILDEAWELFGAGYNFVANVTAMAGELLASIGGAAASLWYDFTIMANYPGVTAAAFFTDIPNSIGDGRALSSLAGAADGAAAALIPLPDGYELPQIGPLFGQDDAYNNGRPVGTVTAFAASLVIGIASGGGSGLVQCASLAQKGVKLWTAFETGAAMVSATVNLHNGKAGLGDVLAFTPLISAVGQRLRGLEDSCFVGGTLVVTVSGDSGCAEPDQFVKVDSTSVPSACLAFVAVAAAPVGLSVHWSAQRRQRRAARQRRRATERVFANYCGMSPETFANAPDDVISSNSALSDSHYNQLHDRAIVENLCLSDVSNRLHHHTTRPMNVMRCAAAPILLAKSFPALGRRDRRPERAVRPWLAQRGAMLWLCGLLAIGAALLAGKGVWPVERPAGVSGTSELRLGPSAASSDRPVLRPIETIQVGDRVLADNPEFDAPQAGAFEKHLRPSRGKPHGRGVAVERRDSTLWWIVRLRMRKSAVEEPEQTLEIVLLRPTNWLAEYAAIPGQAVELDLAELGAAGLAEVLSVEPGARPEPGSGRLVTGTFAHSAAQVIDVGLAGQSETIGCTASHPFWSHDRQAFVPAGELTVGEHLLTVNGGLTQVASISPRAGRARVYNLEVGGEHVYYVSAAGVLVHNSCSPLRSALKGDSDFNLSDEAHHLVPQGLYRNRNQATREALVDSRAILDRHGIDLHGTDNGVGLPSSQHRGIHTNVYIQTVADRLRSADSRGRAAVISELTRIKDEIRAGTFPY